VVVTVDFDSHCKIYGVPIVVMKKKFEIQIYIIIATPPLSSQTDACWGGGVIVHYAHAVVHKNVC